MSDPKITLSLNILKGRQNKIKTIQQHQVSGLSVDGDFFEGRDWVVCSPENRFYVSRYISEERTVDKTIICDVEPSALEVWKKEVCPFLMEDEIAVLLLGWCFASPIIHLENHQQNPLVFVTGRRGCGKSILFKLFHWLFLGGSLVAQTISRRYFESVAHQHNGLPLFLDGVDGKIFKHLKILEDGKSFGTVSNDGVTQTAWDHVVLISSSFSVKSLQEQDKADHTLLKRDDLVEVKLNPTNFRNLLGYKDKQSFFEAMRVFTEKKELEGILGKAFGLYLVSDKFDKKVMRTARDVTDMYIREQLNLTGFVFSPLQKKFFKTFSTSFVGLYLAEKAGIIEKKAKDFLTPEMILLLLGALERVCTKADEKDFLKKQMLVYKNKQYEVKARFRGDDINDKKNVIKRLLNLRKVEVAYAYRVSKSVLRGSKTSKSQAFLLIQLAHQEHAWQKRKEAVQEIYDYLGYIPPKALLEKYFGAHTEKIKQWIKENIPSEPRKKVLTFKQQEIEDAFFMFKRKNYAPKKPLS